MNYLTITCRFIISNDNNFKINAKWSVHNNRVWLQAKQIKIHQQSAKLGPKQLGPFKVTEVLSDVDYRLALPSALHLHDIFHVDHLSPYKGNKVNGLTPPPPNPVTIDGEEEYKVDHIRDSNVKIPSMVGPTWCRVALIVH